MFWLACNVDDFWNFEGPFNSLAEVLKAKQDCIQRYTYDVTPYKQLNMFIPKLKEIKILKEYDKEEAEWVKDDNGNWYLERSVDDEY